MSLVLTVDPIPAVVQGTEFLITGVLTDFDGVPLTGENVNVYVNEVPVDVPPIEVDGRYVSTAIVDSLGVHSVEVTFMDPQTSVAYSAKTTVATIRTLPAEAELPWWLIPAGFIGLLLIL